MKRKEQATSTSQKHLSPTTRILFSENFDRFHECPKRASKEGFGLYNTEQYGALKRMMDAALIGYNSGGVDKFIGKTARELLANMMIHPNDFRNMFSWLHTRRKNILATNARVPMAIGGEPVSVFIPYIIRMTNQILFIWLDFSADKWGADRLLASPSLAAVHLCSLRENSIDPNTAYYTMILNYNGCRALRKDKELVTVLRDNMNKLVGGMAHEKEAARPDKTCPGCPLYKDCDAGQIGFHRGTEEAIFILSTGQDR